jgi:GTP-binding protein HflX
MKKEKVLLVVVDEKRKKTWSVEKVMQELQELVVACSGEVIDIIVSRIERPTASLFIGEGKVTEIASLCCGREVDTVVFSHDLKGSQQRNLEEILEVKTIDRTQLILDIFAKHATSQEGKMQVELAQLEYILPRLVGKGIALSRLGGGIGTLGPGETKLEVDRRRIGQRIAKLKRELDGVVANRAVKRKKRKNKGIPVVSLVGYTNAGKTTLLNKMTDSRQTVRDGLFTTLDSLSRQYILSNHQEIVISDTVGFMHELPYHLIEAFKATLEEVKEADLLLHVLDVSHSNFRDLSEAVLNVLQDIGAVDKPIITVLNKIDKLEDNYGLSKLQSSIEDSVAISAKTGENLEILSKEIEKKLSSFIVDVTVMIPIDRMDLVSLAHSDGQVYSVKYYNDSIYLKAALPVKLVGLFEKAGSLE